MILGGGLLLFLLWYTAVSIICWSLTPLSFYALIIPVGLYLLGTYSLIYLSSIRFILKRMKLRTYLKNEVEYAQMITQKRKFLINKFETLRTKLDAIPQ